MAEQHLVEKAAEFTPPALRALGERILEVICPEQYDDQERKALLAAERRASAATRLSLHVRGDGSVDLRARIPEATAARLQTYLEAFTAPRRSDRDVDVDGVIDETDGRRVPADQRRGQAFCALLEAFDPDRLPLHGGTADHRGGDHPLRRACLGDRRRHPGRRHPDQRQRSPPAGLWCRHPPRRPRRELRGPRPRPHPTTLLHRATQGPRHQPAHLPRRRLHGAVHLVRSPPRRRPLGRGGRTDLDRRDAALLLAPPPHPRRPLPRQEHPDGGVRFHREREAASRSTEVRAAGGVVVATG